MDASVVNDRVDAQFAEPTSRLTMKVRMTYVIAGTGRLIEHPGRLPSPKMLAVFAWLVPSASNGFTNSLQEIVRSAICTFTVAQYEALESLIDLYVVEEVPIPIDAIRAWIELILFDVS